MNVYGMLTILNHEKDENKKVLEEMLIQIKWFLSENLLISLHPDKVFIKTLASGVDFLFFSLNSLIT